MRSYRTENMDYIHSLIPHSKLVVPEGSGHLAAMPRPLDAVREIDAFFGPAPVPRSSVS